MQKNSCFWVFILLVLVGQGCRQAVDSLAADADYFPLQTGDYWIYQVTQETYSLINTPTKQVFQVQQKIGSSFSRNGQVIFQVEESIRKTAQANWQINAIRTVYKNPAEVVSQDNNVPILNLVFPVSPTTSWNVNTYNARPDTLLRYEDGGQAFSVGNRLFDRTISVVGDNDSTLINQQKYRRVYAAAVGLVYREDASLAFCQSSPDCIGKGIITSGTRQKWELLTSNRLP
ncbi:hypothetical protein [Spirosoma areae]